LHVSGNGNNFQPELMKWVAAAAAERSWRCVWSVLNMVEEERQQIVMTNKISVVVTAATLTVPERTSVMMMNTMMMVMMMLMTLLGLLETQSTARLKSEYKADVLYLHFKTLEFLCFCPSVGKKRIYRSGCAVCDSVCLCVCG